MERQEIARSEDTNEQSYSSSTKQQQTTAKDLYHLGKKLGHFRVVGPWHSVDSRYQEHMSNRLASHNCRPCSRGHIEGAWFSEDRKNYSSISRPKTAYEVLREKRSARSRTPQSHYSEPLLRNRREMNRSEGVSPNQSVTSEELNNILKRVTKPTVASQGGKTIAEKFENKDYVYGSRSVNSPEEMNVIVKRITRPTVASTGGAGMERTHTDFVYGDKTVDGEEFKHIIERLTKPTISSEGGQPIARKDFTYIPIRTCKTNPKNPKLSRVQKVLAEKQTVSSDKMDEIVSRLTKLTPAYKAKFALSPHVWVDKSLKGPAFKRELTVE